MIGVSGQLMVPVVDTGWVKSQSQLALAFYLGEARSLWISGTAAFDCAYIIPFRVRAPMLQI
jgi:hypothetical protein